MVLRWGHFSDLHFEYKNCSFQTSTLKEQLLKFLKKQLDDGISLNYLFMTGDMFHKGNNTDKALENVKSFIHQMADNAGCDYENIFPIAGNHDLKRSKARKNNLDNILEEYDTNKEVKYADYSPIVINSVCEPFVSACKQINGREDISLLHSYVCLDKINLFLLNTAIFSGQTYPGQKEPSPELEDHNLYICEEQLFNLKNVINNCSTDALNIVLAHHGTECFVENERIQFLSFLKQLNVDLYLCGHVHKNVFKTLDEANDAKQISCGGLFVDNYNSPSFIIGEYDTETHLVTLQNYHFIAGEWRKSNALPSPYNENGEVKWKVERLISKNKSSKKNSRKTSEHKYKSNTSSFKATGLVKLSVGLDRDKDFIEIRDRAKENITILGVGMSKLSKYALHGAHSLEKISERVPIELIMYDPEYLEDNESVSCIFEDFFGIHNFKQNVRLSFNVLKDFCEKHNKKDTTKHKLSLYVYTSLPTMSAVVIDEKTDQGEILFECFGYHCGQSRPLFLVKKTNNENSDLFSCVNEQIRALKSNMRRIV